MWNVVFFPATILIWFASVAITLSVYERMNGTINSEFALMALSEHNNKNVICSPVATFIPLSKLMLGAKEETLGELEAALGYGQENVQEVIPKYIKLLEDTKGVLLTLLSNVYASSKYTLSERYQATASNIFGTGVYNLDFDSGEASSKFINSWIKGKSGGKINEIITPQEIREVSSLLIITAVTFSGMWKTRFRKMIVKSKFYTPAGFIKVPMLEQALNVPYKRSKILNAQIVVIPFKGDQSDFVIILPDEAEDLNQILSTMVDGNNVIENELKSMKVKGIRIFLPEVSIKCRLDITPTLRKLSMDNLFSGDGLSQMVRNQKLTLDKAIQSTVIEITEFGTSAFFPTIINDMPAGGYELTMLVDKPFIFIIRIKGEHLLVGLYTGIEPTFRNMRHIEMRNYRTFMYQNNEEYDL